MWCYCIAVYHRLNGLRIYFQNLICVVLKSVYLSYLAHGGSPRQYALLEQLSDSLVCPNNISLARVCDLLFSCIMPAKHARYNQRSQHKRIVNKCIIGSIVQSSYIRYGIAVIFVVDPQVCFNVLFVVCEVYVALHRNHHESAERVIRSVHILNIVFRTAGLLDCYAWFSCIWIVFDDDLEFNSAFQHTAVKICQRVLCRQSVSHYVLIHTG